jgi:hypothetical protein
VSAETTPRLLEHLLATDGESLGDVSSWLHDAVADVGELSWDQVTRAVILPFSQEPFGAGGIEPRHLRRTWFYDEYELPLLACRLIVHGAGRPRSRDPLDSRAIDLLGIVHYPAIEALRIDLGDGGWLELPVGSVFVEVEVTDRIAAVVRRRIGRWIPYTSTYSPRPGRSE